VACRCVWSRNLENEEAKARYRAVKIKPQWVVTAGKQTYDYIIISIIIITIRHKLNLARPVSILYDYTIYINILFMIR